MSRIVEIFRSLRDSQKKAVMPFVCGGYPRPGATAGVIRALDQAGAPIIEVGIPFSDPIADGPVIAAAMHEALAAGATPATVFDEVRSVRSEVGAGLIAMVSVSIVHRMGGAEGFVGRAVDAGFDGFIFPDVPLEEAGPLLAAAAARNATATLLVAPTSSFARATEIVKASTGFVYLLARAGITGEGQKVVEVGPRVRKLREVTSLPIAVGFGVSTPEHVRLITRDADAAIVGSAMVRRIGEAHREGRDPAAEAGEFCRGLIAGLSERLPEATTGERQPA